MKGKAGVGGSRRKGVTNVKSLGTSALKVCYKPTACGKTIILRHKCRYQDEI